jgi:hypothetical protein
MGFPVEGAITMTDTSRRTVVGALGVLAVAGNAETAEAQFEPTGKLYGVYTGNDMKSYVAELKGGGPIPVYRMNVGGPMAAAAAKPAAFWGEVSIIMAGGIEVGVSGGDRRTVVGKTGDIFIFIDTKGDGHSIKPVGGELVQQINVRLREPWTALAKNYQWPDHILPPEEVTPSVNF